MILCLGDSITHGRYVPKEDCWVSLIGGFDAGINGDTTRTALVRFPRDVQDVRPEVLIIQFGLNDCTCWETDWGLPRVSEESFRANLKEMIVRARCFDVQKIILTNNHVTLLDDLLEDYEEANARYSRIIESVAQEMAVCFCDTRNCFLAKPGLEFLDPDGVHLNKEGHKLYAKAIGDCL